jgi:hypothetical protein
VGKARKQKTKSFKKSVLIICPGITEKGYISSLRADRYRGLHIDLEPKLDKADKYSEVFCLLRKEYSTPKTARICIYVNDMDTIKAQGKMKDYLDDMNKTVRASNDKLKIIESMPCIEFWFLLHYQYTDRCYPSYDSLKQTIRKVIPYYEKNEQWARKIYSILEDKTNIAVKNADRTVTKKESGEGDCSYTNMHELISKLDELYAQLGSEHLS